MSFWDNESRMVEHICHSFVVSDDTGYADRIFLDDEDSIEESDQGYHLNQRNMTGLGTFWLNHTHSVTKMELDRTVMDIARDAKLHRQFEKVIKLVNQGGPMAGPSLVFTKKTIKRLPVTPSLLSDQLTMVSNPDIPFSQFAKFDATNSNDRRSLPVIIIFESTKNTLKVLARFDIRIFQLIGLSLYLYNERKLGDPLLGSVDNFRLYIADESGEIDKDFPPLSESDFFHKFGFSHLGLSRVDTPKKIQNQEIFVKDCVTIRYKLGDYPVEEKRITMPRPSDQMQVIEILSLAIKKKGLTPSEVYILSETSDGIPLSHIKYLSDLPQKDFWLLKQERSTDFDLISSNDRVEGFFDSSSDHYEACWLNKKGEPITQIIIEETQITLKPLAVEHRQSQKNKFKFHLTLPKTEIINTKSVQRCELLSRPNITQGRRVFCIQATKGSEKKNYEFEADTITSAKIISDLVNKCSNLMKNK